MRAKNLAKGETFGFLKVEKRVENRIQPSGQAKTQYLCRCVCGNYVKVLRTHLVAGDTTSCGCKGKLNGKPRAAETAEKNETGRCLYNKNGIVCKYLKCSECGFYPENKELIEKRLKKINERMRGK